MKKFVTLFLMPVCFAAYGQTTISTLYQLPPSGLQQLKNEHSYIRAQKPAGNDWTDFQLYTWRKAPNVDSIGIRLTSDYQPDNTLLHSETVKDSFVLNNQGRVTAHVNDVMYDFGSMVYQTKTRYIYTYGSGPKPVKAKMQFAEPPSSNNYVNAADVLLHYDQGGRRVHDSTYLFGNGVRLNDYFIYDSNNDMTNRYTLRGTDTIMKEYLTYDGNHHILTAFITSFNQKTDEWDPKKADTLTYDAEGRVLSHSSWGMLITQSNPDEPFFSAISNEYFHYNAAGKLDESILQSGIGGNGWIDQYKITVEYDNANKPVMGYYYIANGIGSWNPIPVTRYLFAAPSGVHDNVNSAAEISIYPNPCSDILHINIHQVSSHIQYVNLYDASGKCIYESTSGEKQINLSDYSNGIYLLQIITNEGRVNQRVMVRK